MPFGDVMCLRAGACSHSWSAELRPGSEKQALPSVEELQKEKAGTAGKPDGTRK